MEKPKTNQEEPGGRNSSEAKNAAGNSGHGAEPEKAVPKSTAPLDDPGNRSLREQLEAARVERDSNYDLYLRTQADLQNFRKRVQKEADESRLYQSLPLARDLLPALDNLHRALAAAEASNKNDELVQGVRLVAKQIEDALSRHQIVPVQAIGKPFDPNLHQAVQHVPSAEHPPMTVIQEVERGFTLNDRIVRPATVIVAAPPAGRTDDDE